MKIKLIGILMLFEFMTLPILYADDCNNPMEAKFLLHILQKLKNGENIIFTKFGDGEYNCMAGLSGCNCDGDNYHVWLGEELKRALIALSIKYNCYIGKWWSADVFTYCDKLAQGYGVTIPWCWYHLFMNDDSSLYFSYMRDFVRFIINTKRKKILMCNHANSRLKDFFKVDTFIEIPSQNWSYQYSKWRDILKQYVESDCIVMIAGGMCSKVLINEITNEYNLTFIDLGCSFDQLGSTKNTRGWKHNYADELVYYKEFIPSSWR